MFSPLCWRQYVCTSCNAILDLVLPKPFFNTPREGEELNTVVVELVEKSKWINQRL